ncbi:MAG: SDR family oxidoreductase [Simkaniaceae bacterium]|nr:SDR family oxidoreductase [Simkaniaceae bacterium]
MKTVLITGATKGIGLATSERLLKEGYTVVGIARSGPFSGKLFTCDLSDTKATEEVIQAIKKEHRIDAIVNNAGLVNPQELGKIEMETLSAVLDFNVRVSVQMTQGFVDQMKQSQWGRIVNISSSSVFGSKGRTAYSAAKAALIACTRSWASELAPYNITVNTIAPGPTETELFRAARPKGSPGEAELLSKLALGRIGKPSEIAAPIAFFLSDDASFITGQTLFVDGGYRL